VLFNLNSEIAEAFQKIGFKDRAPSRPDLLRNLNRARFRGRRREEPGGFPFPVVEARALVHIINITLTIVLVNMVCMVILLTPKSRNPKKKS
jgi:hypothetical protein